MSIATPSSHFTDPVPSGVARHPWGLCECLTMQHRFVVRHLVVRPDQSLSLQSHFHRAEHWLIVSGSGRATISGVTFDLYEGQSVDIPVGATHRIQDHGKVDLHLIEVQTGAYLGDDDEVRYD